MATPVISSFTVTNPSAKIIRVAIEVDQQLAGITCNLTGAVTHSLDIVDFTETGSGPYTYTANHDTEVYGLVTATLASAENAGAEDGADGETGSAYTNANRDILDDDTDGVPDDFEGPLERRQAPRRRWFKPDNPVARFFRSRRRHFRMGGMGAYTRDDK